MNLSIAYSSDNRYAQHMGVSMLSLFENNKNFNTIKVYVIENDISVENKKKLEYIANQYKRELVFINFNDYRQKLSLNIGNSISISSYARLFLADIAYEDKIIYMDCDSVINGNLEELWNIDLEDYYVAGVLDTVSDDTKLRVGISNNFDYINAGMLVINLKKWRDEDIQCKFINFINRYDGNVYHHDQGVINAVLKDKLLVINPKYNAMTTFFTMNRSDMMNYYGMKTYYEEQELNEVVNNHIIIHYTPAFVKRPWIKGCKHPLKNYYIKYLEMTPWKDEPLWNDDRSKGEKLVSFLYNNLPFKTAKTICNFILR